MRVLWALCCAALVASSVKDSLSQNWKALYLGFAVLDGFCAVQELILDVEARLVQRMKP